MHTIDDQYLELLKKCLTASIYPQSAWKIIEPPHRKRLTVLKPWKYVRYLIKRSFLAAIAHRSLMLVERRPFDPGAREAGRDWPCFGYSMAGHRRLDNVQNCIEDILANDIPGDLLEAGVWRGGVTILMRAVLKHHGVNDRTVWAADSFEGMPIPDPQAHGPHTEPDLSEVDLLKVSLEQVKANFARFGLLDDHVRFLKGWFRDTLPNAPIHKLAILRLDGDLYESTMDALTALYHRVSPGGYLIVDDYYSWESCRKAVTDFRAKHRINAQINKIDWTGMYWQVPPTQ